MNQLFLIMDKVCVLICNLRALCLMGFSFRTKQLNITMGLELISKMNQSYLTSQLETQSLRVVWFNLIIMQLYSIILECLIY